jgi:hypothetical protein
VSLLVGDCKEKFFKMDELEISVTLRGTVFWDMTPCGSYKNRHFGGTHHFHHQGGKNRRARNVSSNQQLKHTAKKY